MHHLASTCPTLFSRILRQTRQDTHPDRNPMYAETSGSINNAVDIVEADMQQGGPQQLVPATQEDIRNTVSSLKMDLYFCQETLKSRRGEVEAMRVVAAEAEEEASWWKNWAYEKEAAARYAEGDLARWKNWAYEKEAAARYAEGDLARWRKWAYENEAAARHADRDLKSWKNWQSRIEEQHEAKQNVLQNQINEFKQRGSEAAGVPGAKKARCTYP
jgi:hypothetical protein